MFYLDERDRGVGDSQRALREKNLRRVFGIVRQSGQIARAELSRRCALSPSTISSLVEDLVRSDLIRQTGLGKAAATSGRRPILLSVNPSGRQIPVFSLGVSGVAYALYDLSGLTLERGFHPCLFRGGGEGPFREAGERYARIIAGVMERPSSILDRGRVPAILLSYPGIYLEEEGRFLLTATGTSFTRETMVKMGEMLGLPVYAGNASQSLAWAEKRRLEALGQAADDLMYVNVCSGVGAGLILRGEAFLQPGCRAGEIGHMTILEGGRPCPCGNRGCLERYVSIDAILREVRAALAEEVRLERPELVRDLMEDDTLASLSRALELDMAALRAPMERVARWLAAGIASAVNVTGISRVALGGLQPLGGAFLEQVRRHLTGGGERFLMRHVTLDYAHTLPEEEGLGIAQCFIDRAFPITGSGLPGEQAVE